MINLREYNDFEKETQKMIYSLTKIESLIFAGACCERMVNSYHRSSEGKTWRNVELFRESLDAVWDCITYDKKIGDDFVHQLENILPDRSRSIVDEAAISSVLVLSELIGLVNVSEFSLEHNECIVKISDEILDQIYQILCSESEINDTDKYDYKFMFLELQRQRQDLEDISSCINNDKIQRIRSRSKNIDLTTGIWYSF